MSTELDAFSTVFHVREVITACGLSLEAAACTDQTNKPKIHYTLFTLSRNDIHDQKHHPSATPQCSPVSCESRQQSRCISRVSYLYSDYVPGDRVFDNSVRLHNYRYDGRRLFSDRVFVRGRKKTRQGETSGRLERWR
jgi:hypothetical protein